MFIISRPACKLAVRRLLPAFCVGIVSMLPAHAADIVQIRLRPAVTVTKSDVRLPDVATFFVDGQMKTLEDLPAHLRILLNQVKVVQLNQQRQAAMVTRDSLKPRLERLGIHAEQFELIGTRAILVTTESAAERAKTRSSPFQLASASKALPAFSGFRSLPAPQEITDLTLEQTIREQLAAQFGMNLDDVKVLLTRKVVSTSGNALKSVVSPVVQVTPPTRFPYGRATILVRVLDGNRVAQIWNVAVDVRVRKRLLVATRPLQPGMKLNEGLVEEEVRFTDRLVDQLSSSDVVDMEVVKPLQTGDVITYGHVRAKGTGPSGVSRPLVTSRQSVRVVAKRKRLSVSMPNAEALESGREGELIRVRNLRSDQVFSAKVVGPGAVEVAL